MAKWLSIFSPIIGISKLITAIVSSLIILPWLTSLDFFLLILTLIVVFASPFAIIYGFTSVSMTYYPLYISFNKKEEPLTIMIRYNPAFMFTLKLKKAILRYPRCILPKLKARGPWDGKGEMDTKEVQEGENKLQIYEWEEDSQLKKRNQWFMRFSVKLDSSFDYLQGPGLENFISFTFYFSMARGLYNSVVTEDIRILHPMIEEN